MNQTPADERTTCRLPHNMNVAESATGEGREPDRTLGTTTEKLLLDQFEDLEVIGFGGMGTILKARHKLLDQPVAIKVLQSCDNLDFKRFQQEAIAAFALHHENIVRALDLKRLDNGLAYMVMEYLPGVSLDSEITNNGRVATARAVDIFIQVCRGMSFAHQNGILHRDLKPANIMLYVPQGEQGEGKEQAKIVDFGIAKFISAERQQQQRITCTGDVVGSPLYMSPEQVTGKSLDKRSDIYAMGCVMYETLSGHPPHRGANALETFFKHLNDYPQALRIEGCSVEQATQIEQTILKALAKDPADRYQTMSDLCDDLEIIRANLKAGTMLPVSFQVENRRPAFGQGLAGMRWLSGHLKQGSSRSQTMAQKRNLLSLKNLCISIALALFISALLALSITWSLVRNEAKTLSRTAARVAKSQATVTAHRPVQHEHWHHSS